MGDRPLVRAPRGDHTLYDRRMLRLAALLALAWGVLVFAWADAPWALCFDDTFYYFALARNLAAGHGFTFDRLNPTNGFHPLWLGFCVPLFWAGLDGLAAVRVALAGQVLLYAGGLVLVWRGLHLRGGLIATVLALAAAGPAVIKTFVSGMEAGLVVPIHGALLVAPTDTRRQRLMVAALGAAAFLARTDAGFLLLWMGLFSLRRPFVELLELFLLPGLTILAFLAWNQLTFGAPMQVSGLLKFSTPTPLRMAWILVCLALPFVLGRLRSSAFPLLTGFCQEHRWYLMFVGTIVAWYTGVQTFPRLWYFAPAALLGLVALTLVAADLSRLAAREGSPRALAALLGVPLALGFALQWATALDPRGYAVLRADAEAGAWIAENLPAEAVLGSWDAGAIGYFAAQRVVNLDGVVNSHAYLAALRDGTTPAFLRDVQMVVNHDARNGEDVAAHARRITGREPELVKRWDYAFAGSSNRDAVGVHPMGTFLFRLK